MKRIVLLLILLLNLSAAAQSKFYQSCAHRDEVAEAVFIKNYPIDGCKVDITLLRAKDSSSFAKLLSEFGLSPRQTSSVGVLICLRNDADPRMCQPVVDGQIALKNTCCIGASQSERTIYVFHGIRNGKRYQKILRFIMEKHR